MDPVVSTSPGGPRRATVGSWDEGAAVGTAMAGARSGLSGFGPPLGKAAARHGANSISTLAAVGGEQRSALSWGQAPATAMPAAAAAITTMLSLNTEDRMSTSPCRL